MSQVGEWTPANAPLDEGYWNALLNDPENGNDASYLTRERNQITDELKEQWAQVYKALESGEVIELPVVESNRGGVVIGWNGLRGFVPASHLTSLPPRADEQQRRQELKSLIGRRLYLKVIEIDRSRNQVILSERACRRAEKAATDPLDALCPGDICQGRVTKLCPFGAFVDLGGVEGLVHISELSWGRVNHPRDALEVNQPVEVYVLNVDRAARRIGLSIKRLQPDPWQSIQERYHVNQEVEGVITRLADFGAFVLLDNGVEGLIHVSELADGSPAHPRDIVAVGDRVRVRILQIDGDHRRIRLSLRQDNG